jgi:2-hydroxy-6-oxonona-2,4-dienedioate hydrolase
MNRRALLLGAAAIAAGGAIATHSAFASDMARASRRLEGRSAIAPSRFGDIEYAVAGEGRPILMVHGTGGGFDQSLAAAPRLVAAGYKVIAPSRFGYLRSSFPAEPSSENQADALVDLLDDLGIDRVPIIGVSAGALSALAFGIRHPERCAAVIPLVPASYVPGRAPQPPSRLAAAIYEHALKSDLLFWLGLKLAERTMIQSILATDVEVFRHAAPPEQQRARQLLWDILPVSHRAEGLRNDARLAGNPDPMPIERIRAPTLTISLEDDRYGTFEAARHIANSVPGARLVSYPTGGHVWLGRDADVHREIDIFLKAL